MSCSYDNDVIDLTNSFTLVEHNNLQNIVIDLVADSDDSIIDTTNPSIRRNSESSNMTGIVESTRATSHVARIAAKQKLSLIPIKKDNKKGAIMNTTKINSRKFDKCPICLEELGKNPLASTKCGHVYCLKCLQSSLKTEKKCPNCRCTLKGNSAYHPLYLGRY